MQNSGWRSSRARELTRTRKELSRSAFQNIAFEGARLLPGRRSQSNEQNLQKRPPALVTEKRATQTTVVSLLVTH